jgi:hypothetical protein
VVAHQQEGRGGGTALTCDDSNVVEASLAASRGTPRQGGALHPAHRDREAMWGSIHGSGRAGTREPAMVILSSSDRPMMGMDKRHRTSFL